MAVAFDASSESHTGTTGVASVASFSWTHTPVGTPRGVVVFCLAVGDKTDIFTGVTYGGVAMTEVTLGIARDSTTEIAVVKAYFLGAALPTGAQTIEVSRTNNATVTYAAALTVTAGADTSYTGVTRREENSNITQVEVSDANALVNSLRVAGIYTGSLDVTPGAGSTREIGIQFTNYTFGLFRETTAGTGTRPVGMLAATDDRAEVYLAIREVVAGATDTTTLDYTGAVAGDTLLAVLAQYGGVLTSIWTAGASMGTPRGDSAGAGTQTAALSFGGVLPNGITELSTTEEYDGISWSAGGALATARESLAGAGTQTAALSIGGWTSAVSTITEEYDGTSWASGGALATGRYWLAGCGTQTAGLSFGGSPSSSTVTEEYDGTSWAAGGALATGRANLAGCGTQTAGLSFGGIITATLSAVTEEYNGTSWSAGGALATARRDLGGCGTQTAGLSFGGSILTELTVNTEEYDGTSWSAGTGLLVARAGQAGCGTQTAGLSSGVATEEYGKSGDAFSTPGVWSSSGSLSTPRRELAGAGTQTAALSFGGYSGVRSAVTEEYNGTSWASGGNLATAREGLAGCGTQTAGLSFGGMSNIDVSADTEEYDGTSWSTGGNLAQKRVYLAGCGTQTAGLSVAGDNTGTALTDVTEEYDGTSWSSGGSLVSERDGLAGCGTQTAALSYGGEGLTSIFNTCHEYDGTSWASRNYLVLTRRQPAGAGTVTAALAIARSTSRTDSVEEYDGSVWSLTGGLTVSCASMGGAGTRTAGLAFGGYEGSTSQYATISHEYTTIPWRYVQAAVSTNALALVHIFKAEAQGGEESFAFRHNYRETLGKAIILTTSAGYEYLSVTAATVNTGTNSSPISPTITPSTSGSNVVIAGVAVSGDSSPITEDTDLTDLYEVQSSASAASVGMYIGKQEDVVGASGTYTHTIASSDDWVGFTLYVNQLEDTGFAVTDVDLDETITNGQTGVIISITGTVPASGKKVFIVQGANSVEQTVTAENASSATITVSYGGVLTGGAATLYVRKPL